MTALETGRLIAARRKALGLTQKELAERLLVSDKAVSKWETGGSFPEVTLLPSLAETLGLSVDALLAGEPVDSGSAPAPSASQLAALIQDQINSADDRLLLAGIAALLLEVIALATRGPIHLAFLLFTPFLFFGVILWHSRRLQQIARLHTVNTAVSCRREKLLCGVCIAAVASTFLYQILFYRSGLLEQLFYSIPTGSYTHLTINAAYEYLFLSCCSIMLFVLIPLALLYRRLSPKTPALVWRIHAASFLLTMAGGVLIAYDRASVSVQGKAFAAQHEAAFQAVHGQLIQRFPGLHPWLLPLYTGLAALTVLALAVYAIRRKRFRFLVPAAVFALQNILWLWAAQTYLTAQWAKGVTTFIEPKLDFFLSFSNLSFAFLMSIFITLLAILLPPIWAERKKNLP